MFNFSCDYTEGCAPEILQSLTATNMEQTAGYGEDPHCQHARELIKKACGREDAEVHFFIGGTQANLNIILNCLDRPYYGLFATTASHVNTHEAGAIERTGHKVMTIPSVNDKLTAEGVEKAYQHWFIDPSRNHIVEPKLVYISQPTESGTMYSKKELTDLYAVCQKHDLYLFVDGARLGYGLCAPTNDVSLPDLAQLCDVFYIGGTKCGALLGEAAVLLNPKIKRGFFTLMKQGGAVLAKGRVVGIQFETLFTNNLYRQICQNGMDCALKIKAVLREKKIPLYIDSPSNQQFPILSKAAYEKLSRQFELGVWAYLDDGRLVVRICTSWATRPEAVEAIIKAIKEL